MVTVNADRRDLMKAGAGYTSYTLSSQALKAKSAYESLREIPQLIIDENSRTIRLSSGETPVILINGVSRPGYFDSLNPENFLSDGLFVSEETKYAGFASYAGKLGRLDWSAGVRYEQFLARYYENGAVDPSVKRTYKELYPSVSLSLPADPFKLSLSYSKRTSRPSFYQLRNGIEYSNQYLYSQGNPYLRSSQLHDLSFKVTYRSFSFSTGYNYTKDLMVSSDMILEGKPFTLVSFHKNADKYQSLNMMLTFHKRIGFWSPTWTIAVYKDYLKLYDERGKRMDLGNPYGYIASYNMFSLPKGFVLNIDGYYITEGNSNESFSKSTSSLEIGIRKSFFKGKLDINLQIQDLLASSERRKTVFTTHRTFYRWSYNDNRMIRLTMVYNFNTYKKKYKGQNSAQDEIWRM